MRLPHNLAVGREPSRPFLSSKIHHSCLSNRGLIQLSATYNIKVSLSHGTTFIFDGYVAHDTLLEAVGHCMDRHPMLRAYIFKEADFKKECWLNCGGPSSILAQKVLTTEEVSDSDFDSRWKDEMEYSVNSAQFPKKGPLWIMKNIVSDSPKKRSSWSFCFNHGTDDQLSVNILVKDLLDYIQASEISKFTKLKKITKNEVKSLPFPKCVEDAVGPGFPSVGTLKWGVFQLGNTAQGADVLPAKIVENYAKNPEKYLEEYANPNNRKTLLEYFTLTKEETTKLRLICRKNGVTITNALSAIILSLTSSYFQNVENNDDLQTKKIRFLLSVGLRPFGVNNPNEKVNSVLSSSLSGTENASTGTGTGTGSGKSSSKSGTSDWTGGTVACASGAVDFVVSVPSSTAIQAREIFMQNSIKNSEKNSDITSKSNGDLWRLAEVCKEKVRDIIEVNNYVPESVRLFGFGMDFADILTIVDVEAKNPANMGRGYSCGVSNVGVVNLPIPSASTVDDENTKGFGEKVKISGNIAIKSAYYGTSHSRNGVFCLLSSMTAGDTLCGCLQFCSPFIGRDEAVVFRESLKRMIQDL